MAIAFGYFTRFPVPPTVLFTEARLARSGRYFPVVGAVVGVLGALVFGIASHFWSLPIAVLLSMAATLLATGALHEDGLADCCDAFGGGYRRSDVLRILKDSRIGVFGAIGLIVTLALKWQALVGLAASGPAIAGMWMIAAHAASRAGAIVFTATLDYARGTVDRVPAAKETVPTPDAATTPDATAAACASASEATAKTPSADNAAQDDGTHHASLDAKARPFQRSGADDPLNASARNNAGIALLIGLPGLFWHSVALGLLLIAVGAALHWVLGQWWQRRIGGYTGDCLGLAQQLFEVGIYLLVLGWISS